MPQKIIVENNIEKLLIYVSVRCKEHPSGRIQLKRRCEGIEKGSTKANAIEKELLREADREKAQRENLGTNWEALIGTYELYARDLLNKGNWCQGQQTFDEAIRALHKWTHHWFKESAARISASDVTKLFTR